MACKKRTNKPPIPPSLPSTSTSTSEQVDLGMFIFMPNEKCFCYESDMLYEVKVLNVDLVNDVPMYYVHYTGWNKCWDRWAYAEDLHPYNEYTMMKAKMLREKAKRRIKIKEKSATASNQIPNASTQYDGDEEISSDDENADDNFPKFMQFSGQMFHNFLKQTDPFGGVSEATDVLMADGQYLLFGDNNSRLRLSSYIVDEYVPRNYQTKIPMPASLDDAMRLDTEMVGEQRMVPSVPAPHTVHQLLEAYQLDRLHTSSSKECALRQLCGPNYNQIVQEFTTGIANYFDTMLPKRLLYKAEKPKYLDIFYPQDDEWKVDGLMLQNIVIQEKPLKKFCKPLESTENSPATKFEQSKDVDQSTEESLDNKTKKLVIKETDIKEHEPVSNVPIKRKLFETTDQTECESDNESSKGSSKIARKIPAALLCNNLKFTSSFEETKAVLFRINLEEESVVDFELNDSMLHELFKKLILFAFNKHSGGDLDIEVDKCIAFLKEKQFSLLTLQAFHQLLVENLKPVRNNSAMIEQLWINLLVLSKLYQKIQENAAKNIDDLTPKQDTYHSLNYKICVTAKSRDSDEFDDSSNSNAIPSPQNKLEDVFKNESQSGQSNLKDNMSKVETAGNNLNKSSSVNSLKMLADLTLFAESASNQINQTIDSNIQNQQATTSDASIRTISTPDTQTSPLNLVTNTRVPSLSVENQSNQSITSSITEINEATPSTSVEHDSNPLNLLAEVSLFAPEQTSQERFRTPTQPANPLSLLAEIGSTRRKVKIKKRKQCRTCLTLMDIRRHHCYVKKRLEVLNYIPRELRLKVNSRNGGRPKRLGKNKPKQNLNIDSEDTLTATESGSDDDPQNERFQNSILKKIPTKFVLNEHPRFHYIHIDDRIVKFDERVKCLSYSPNLKEFGKIQNAKLKHRRRSQLSVREGAYGNITIVQTGIKTVLQLQPSSTIEKISNVQTPSTEIVWFPQLESLNSEMKIPRSRFCREVLKHHGASKNFQKLESTSDNINNLALSISIQPPNQSQVIETTISANQTFETSLVKNNSEIKQEQDDSKLQTKKVKSDRDDIVCNKNEPEIQMKLDSNLNESQTSPKMLPISASDFSKSQTSSKMPSTSESDFSESQTSSKMPSNSASDFSESQTSGQIPSTSASDISGTITSLQLPSTSASDISESFTSLQLPSTSASEISESQSSLQLPSTSTSKSQTPNIDDDDMQAKLLMWQDFGLRKSTRVKSMCQQSSSTSNSTPLSPPPSSSLLKVKKKKKHKPGRPSTKRTLTKGKLVNESRKVSTTNKLLKSTYKEFPELADIHDILQEYENKCEAKKQAEIDEWKEYKVCVSKRLKEVEGNIARKSTQRLDKSRRDMRTFANTIVELGLCEEFKKFEKSSLETKRAAAVVVMETYHRIQQKNAEESYSQKELSFNLKIFSNAKPTTENLSECDLLHDLKRKLLEIEEEKCNNKTICQYIQFVRSQTTIEKINNSNINIANNEKFLTKVNSVSIPMDLSITKKLAAKYGKINGDKIGTLPDELACDALKTILQSSHLCDIYAKSLNSEVGQNEETNLLMQVVQSKLSCIIRLIKKQHKFVKNPRTKMMDEMPMHMQDALSEHPYSILRCSSLAQLLMQSESIPIYIVNKFLDQQKKKTTKTSTTSAQSQTQVLNISTKTFSPVATIQRMFEVKNDSNELKEAIKYMSTLSQIEWQELCFAKIKAFAFAYIILSQVQPQLLTPIFTKRIEGFARGLCSGKFINTKKLYDILSGFDCFNTKFSSKLAKRQAKGYSYLLKSNSFNHYQQLLDLLKMIEIYESLNRLESYKANLKGFVKEEVEKKLKHIEPNQQIEVLVPDNMEGVFGVEFFPSNENFSKKCTTAELAGNLYKIDEFKMIIRQKWYEFYESLSQETLVRVCDVHSLLSYEIPQNPLIELEAEQRAEWLFNNLTQHESGAIITPRHLYSPIHLLRLLVMITTHLSRLPASNRLLYLTTLYLTDLLDFMASQSTQWFGPQYYDHIDYIHWQRYLEPNDLSD